jgi:DNA-binding transcriptional ArsR family regulator
MLDSPDVSSVAALIGGPARSRMLEALLDGRSLTATELALASEVAPSTASSHLEKMAGAGMLTVMRQGRHRYFRLASQQVAAALEALMLIAPRTRSHPVRPGPRHPGLRWARVCYDHLAGEAAVSLLQRLNEEGWIHSSRDTLTVTPSGEAGFRRLGVDVGSLRRARRPLCRPCLDWSERRTHLAGGLGAALLDRLLALRLARRTMGSRLVTFSPQGIEFLRDLRPPSRG